LGHRALVIALLAGAVTLGCAGARWTVLKPFRTPGESLQTFPDAVWTEYDCDSQVRPFFAIEKNELTPIRVSAGSDFGHRMVYVLCPSEPTAVVPGQLSTRIRFKGAAVVEQTEPGYEIKPGRWVVDAIVHLPENAEPGIYAYEVAFESPSVRFEESSTFLVQKGFALGRSREN
jgi:hypothetical protein